MVAKSRRAPVGLVFRTIVRQLAFRETARFELQAREHARLDYFLEAGRPRAYSGTHIAQLLLQIELAETGQWETRAAQVIVDAEEHHRAA
jgi:hypothetical protein